MFDFRFINEKMTGIGGHSVTTMKVGKKVFFVQANGNITERIISPVKCCSNSKTRHISITIEMTMEVSKLSRDK